MNPADLKTQNRKNPIGVGSSIYFSWILESNIKNTKQTFYHLTVYDESQKPVWDTGKILSKQSVYIRYEGQMLSDCSIYNWEVTVWDNHGNEATATAVFETSILQPSRWSAKWVAAMKNKKRAKKGNPASYFRKSFTLRNNPVKARVYATCHGIYYLTLNNLRADDRELAPEFTVYKDYLCVQTYDVTKLLKQGDNILDMTVGDGWYHGGTTKQTYKCFDDRHACLWQLEVTYADGSMETVCSDGEVKTASGPITASDLFHGESYDANIKIENWTPAVIADFGYDNLVPQDGEPVRPVITLPIKEIIRTPKDETILDLGQNIAGRLRAKINIPKGETVTFEHSETLDGQGNYFNNIMGINQKDTFVSSGQPVVFEPAFTFHGFRYVHMTGISNPRKEDYEAIVLSTDEEWISSFECSDGKINRLVENTRWSQRANMLSVPTDCPQREKMGWMGDMTVYARTALMNQNLTGLFSRWLESLTLSQLLDGQVPNVIPLPDFYRMVSKLTNILLGGSFKDISSSGWGDAAVIVPWTMYEMTGNTAVLERQYKSMKAWIEYMRRQAATKRNKKSGVSGDMEKYLWNTGFHFGEWLIPSATERGSMSAAVRKSAKAGRHYIAPVYYYISCKIFSDIARLLGKNNEADSYSVLAEKIKTAYQKSMVLPGGRLKVDVQGAYALALGAGLIPNNLRAEATARLVMLIQINGDRLDTGFLPTPFLLDALSDNGHAELAYRLLRQDQRPGWMYEVDKGATTIWENWNIEDEKGKVKKISMNHYAFGCVADWIYRKTGGITRVGAGYERFLIQPLPDEKLNWCKYNYRSPHGEIVCCWQIEGGKFVLYVKVPCNAKATVILPDGQQFEIGSGLYQYECDYVLNAP